MATIRRAKKNKYSAISNSLLQNPNLTFECRGLIAYLLSKPDDWECRISDIEREGKIGRTERRRIMAEAEKEGYLTYTSERQKNGKFVDFYTVHEEPVIPEHRTDSSEINRLKFKLSPKDTKTVPVENQQQPSAGLPHSVKPHSENPNTVNLHTYKVLNNKNTSVSPIQATAESSPIHQALTEYRNLFKLKFGVEPNINWGKDSKLIKGIVDHYGLEMTKECLRRFLNLTDPFVVDAGYPIGIFSTRFNGLLIIDKQTVRSRMVV